MNVIVETTKTGALEITAGAATITVDRSGDSNVVSFHSVDLFLAGLGSCMVGTMLDAAEASGISAGNVRVELRPIITFTPERVSKIKMKMFVDGAVSQAQVEELKLAAESCKVHNSLHTGVITELDITTQPSE
jgi:uncharacterized OsmC-like protein